MQMPNDPTQITHLTGQIAGQIAWWERLRQEHIAARQSIAAGKCAEEIGLLQQELADV